MASRVGEAKKKQILQNSQAQLTPWAFRGDVTFLKTKAWRLVKMGCPKYSLALFRYSPSQKR